MSLYMAFDNMLSVAQFAVILSITKVTGLPANGDICRIFGFQGVKVISEILQSMDPDEELDVDTGMKIASALRGDLAEPYIAQVVL